jgi:tetratricopeptide (TPR) repeat protein
MSKTIEQLTDQATQDRRANKFGDAKRAWAEAVGLSRQANDMPGLIRALRGAAQIEHDLGRDDEALALYEEAVLLCGKHSQPLVLAHTIRHLGDIQRHLGQYRQAQASYEKALGIYQSEPEADPLDVANALRPFAILKEATGDLDGARNFWTEARGLYESLGIAAGVIECSDHLAKLGDSGG